MRCFPGFINNFLFLSEYINILYFNIHQIGYNHFNIRFLLIPKKGISKYIFFNNFSSMTHTSSFDNIGKVTKSHNLFNLKASWRKSEELPR